MDSSWPDLLIEDQLKNINGKLIKEKYNTITQVFFPSNLKMNYFIISSAATCQTHSNPNDKNISS